MFGFITKLFKSQEFYLELDEAEAGKAKTEAPAKEAEPVKAVIEKVKAAVPTPELGKELEPVKAVVEKVKEAVPTPEPAKAKSTEPAKEPKPVKPAAAKPAKAKSKKSVKQAEPAKAAAASTNGKVKPQPGLTFAPNYLLPLSTSRRRPGPSMNMFREMARGVKTPK